MANLLMVSIVGWQFKMISPTGALPVPWLGIEPWPYTISACINIVLLVKEEKTLSIDLRYKTTFIPYLVWADDSWLKDHAGATLNVVESLEEGEEDTKDTSEKKETTTAGTTVSDLYFSKFSI